MLICQTQGMLIRNQRVRVATRVREAWPKLGAAHGPARDSRGPWVGPGQLPLGICYSSCVYSDIFGIFGYMSCIFLICFSWKLAQVLSSWAKSWSCVVTDSLKQAYTKNICKHIQDVQKYTRQIQNTKRQPARSKPRAPRLPGRSLRGPWLGLGLLPLANLSETSPPT